MGPLAAYSIESAVLLSIMYAAYTLSLRQVKDATIRRVALLGICTLAFLLPLFHNFAASGNPEVTTVALTHDMSFITDDISTPIAYTLAVVIIIAGMCVASIVSIAGIIRILLLRTKNIYRDGIRFRIMTGSHPSPFCFFGSIYITEDDFQELPGMILAHENSHIAHCHFIDLFIGRVALILQWWNPFAWLLVREMQQVHEYQADSDVLNAGYDSREYQYLILSRSAGGLGSGFINGFKHRKMKKRLKMINREESNRKKAICLLALIPVTLFALVIPLSSDRFMSEPLFAISHVSFQNLGSQNKENANSGKPYVTVDGVSVPYEALETLNPEAINSISVKQNHPELYPNGMIEVETIPGKEIFNKGDRHQDDELKIIGTGTIKKE